MTSHDRLCLSRKHVQSVRLFIEMVDITTHYFTFTHQEHSTLEEHFTFMQSVHNKLRDVSKWLLFLLRAIGHFKHFKSSLVRAVLHVVNQPGLC